MTKTLLTLAIYSFSVAASANTFLPLTKCTWENSEHIPSIIEATIYSESIFDISDNIQMLYSFPEFAEDGENFTVISSLEKKSGVYVGKMTNLDYLLDVEINIDTISELKLIDKQQTYIFKGSCK